MLNEFVESARSRGWVVDLLEIPDETLPLPVEERYTSVPVPYREFLARIAACVSPDEKTWFLGRRDFENPTEFRWNEFERMSIRAAEDDDAWLQEITTYWSLHIPIVMSVRTGYAYLALSLAPDTFGSVVFGAAPAFEESTPVCGAFVELLQRFIVNQDPWTVL